MMSANVAWPIVSAPAFGHQGDQPEGACEAADHSASST